MALSKLERPELRQYWKDRRAKDASEVAAGRVLIRSQNSRLQISAPYNSEFNRRGRELGGKWRQRTRVWSFPWDSHRLVLQLVCTIYGESALGTWNTYYKGGVDDKPPTAAVQLSSAKDPTVVTDALDEILARIERIEKHLGLSDSEDTD